MSRPRHCESQPARDGRHQLILMEVVSLLGGKRQQRN